MIDLMFENKKFVYLVAININTRRLWVEEVKGKVCVLGLGVGYFSYMAHLKDNVKSITIYEQNQELIDLFDKYILPKFDHKEKIKIIKMAPMSYLKAKDDKNKYDYIYNNVWDSLDEAVKLYPQYRKLEKNHPNSKYLYFLENSINSYPKGE